VAHQRVLLPEELHYPQRPQSRRIEAFIDRHGMQLLQAARRHSSSGTDADDAFQRTCELLLTKAPEGDDDRLLAWALTVAKNEAMMEHRRRAKIAPDSFEEIFDAAAAPEHEPQERVVDAEDLHAGRQALRLVKPDQARCMLLRADGSDYDEICRITGFSYAKVNRCLSEGRQSFRDRVSRIDSGEECRSIAGRLSRFADGELQGVELAETKQHLSNCLMCRATVRDYRLATKRVHAALPLGIALTGTSSGMLHRVAEALQSAYAWLQERLAQHLPTLQLGGEASAAKKIALAAGAAASLVAGGAAVQQVTSGGDDPQSRAPAATSSVPMAAPEIAHRSLTKPQRTRRARAERARTAREAKAEDVVGGAAGKPAGSLPEDNIAQVGGSAPDAGNAKPAGGDAGEGGSSEQSPELAP
jgi:RNA polymerase sigma factor (sigma-70 family)